MKVYIHKLGCPKNDVDADYMAARLISGGHELVNDPEKADAVVVNTCGFIQDAKEESIEAILRLGQLKKTGRVKKLIAAGCLSQRYGDELLADIEELDGALGLGQLDALAEITTSPGKRTRVIKEDARQLAYLDWTDRSITDNLPYSYVKISDGCNCTCSFCAIPAIRGRFRSRPIESILNEAKFLAKNGKRELILVSQEATYYGFGLAGKVGLIDLLRELEQIEGIEWLRLLYLHPARTSLRLVDYLGGDNKCLPYFDLPLQHISDRVLGAMDRGTNRARITELLAAIRSRVPQAALRTSFMVGFPGETETEFEELYEFVAENRFDRMGVFTFSSEEGTAAASLSDQLPQATMVDRLDRLMSLQRDIALDKNNSLIDKELAVIIDTVSGTGEAVGRSKADAPEIDQEVRVSGAALVGQICRVRIERVDGYDLEGSVVGE